MAISLVTSSSQLSTSGNGFTSASIDTTGANFIVIAFVRNATGGTISDSKGNTWTALTDRQGGFADRFTRLFYAENAIVGTGHTFTCTGSSNFPAMYIAAYSGMASSSSFDAETGNGIDFTNSIQPGSITPANTGELLVFGFSQEDTTAPTINQSFTFVLNNPGGGAFGHTAGGLAHIIETSIVAKNPTLTSSGATRMSCAMAAFKEAGGGGDISGTLAVTETADSAAFAVDNFPTGTLAATEAADTAAFTGDVVSPLADQVVFPAASGTRQKYIGRFHIRPNLYAAPDYPTGGVISGTLAVSEAADTAAFVGDVPVEGPLAITEAPDIAAFAGSVAWTGTLAATEAPDIAAFTGDAKISASLTATEAADTAAFNGSVLVSGTLAATEAADIAAFNGQAVINAVLAVTESQDIAAFDAGGLPTITGTFNITEPLDTAAFSGQVVISAALAVTEGVDTAAFAGFVGVSGVLAATEAQDSASFAGSVAVGPSGTLAVTENPDIAAFAGSILVSGTLAATEAKDIAAFNGAVLANITGTLAATEAQDSAAFYSFVPIPAILAASEAPDRALFIIPMITPAPSGDDQLQYGWPRVIVRRRL